MTTFGRKMRRNAFRRSGREWAARQQPTFALPDGGYCTLRPTKGWLPVSAARLRAQAKLRSIYELIAARKGL